MFITSFIHYRHGTVTGPLSSSVSVKIDIVTLFLTEVFIHHRDSAVRHRHVKIVEINGKIFMTDTELLSA